MHEPIEDGIAKCGVADNLVPVLDRDLTRDEGRPPPGAVFDDLQEIASLAVAEGGQAPVVEDERVGFGQRLKEFGVGAVGPKADEIFAQEAREPGVADGVALPTGTLAQRAGEPRLPGAGRPDQRRDLVRAAPLRAREAQPPGTIESAFRPEVDVLDARIDAEAGELEEARQPAIAARCFFAFEQEGEAVLETERREIADAALFVERLDHPVQAAGAEEGERLRHLE